MDVIWEALETVFSCCFVAYTEKFCMDMDMKALKKQYSNAPNSLFGAKYFVFYFSL